MRTGDLDLADDGPFVFQLHAEAHTLPAPTSLTHQEVILALETRGRSLVPRELRLTWNQVDTLASAWSKHYDLGTAREARRLCMMIDRYGDAIEYDLAVRGIDLHELWGRRRWRKLLNLIDRLPRNSHLVEAQAADEDLARALANRPPPATTGPRWSEYTPELEAMLTAVDRLGDLVSTLVAVNSKNGRGPKIPRAARPRSAAQRLRAERRREKHLEIVAQLLPGGPSYDDNTS